LQANANANSLEKKQRAFDKTIQEWQSKVADLQSELENAQKEARSYSAELFRCKAQYEESQDSVEALRRENKNLAGKRYIFMCLCPVQISSIFYHFFFKILKICNICVTLIF
jgi:septal ring factor EnvC (AmiA/AmiB activator)